MPAPLAERDIVVGVDGSPASHCAVAWAARDAALRNVRLSIVHAIRPLGVTLPAVPKPSSLAGRQAQRAQTIIDDALQVAQQAAPGIGRGRIASEVLFSPVIPALVELSNTAQLVVVGSRGLGVLARTILGSVSTNLIRHAHCPVAVIRDEDPLMPQPVAAPVLVGIDGSPASELATAIAFDEAARRGVELVALHAWSDVEVLDFPEIDWSAVKPQAEEVLAERLAGWQERYPDVKVRRVVECSQPTAHLIARSEQAQLVVVGSHGRGGFAGMLLGSVATTVAQASRMPVIVARS